ncbi:MAG: phospholipase [Bacteroidota bacterium]
MEHHIEVRRTARYFTAGTPGPHIREIWFVQHGYGMLAQRFLRHFEWLAGPKTLVVAPEALSRFYADGVAGHVGACWMTKEDRLAEIDDYLGFLNAVHAEILAQTGPNVRIHLLGFSQGTATTWRWLRKGKVKAESVITWTGSFPKELSLEWIASHPDLALHIVFASRDKFIALDMALARARQVKKQVPHLQIHTFDGEHRMHEETFRKIVDLIRDEAPAEPH